MAVRGTSRAQPKGLWGSSRSEPERCRSQSDVGPRIDVITHLEPDFLECEVKWALESITTNKANGGDGIPVELFQILKDDAVKVLLAPV